MPKPQTKDNFSKHAKTYDQYAVVQRQAAKKLAVLIPRQNIRSILEIGCGTGLFTKYLLNKYPRAKISAVDFSPAMLKAARQAIPSSRVKFILADAQTITPKKKFDLICSNACLHWLDNPSRAIKQYWGELAPGGHLLFSAFGPQTYRELQAALRMAFGQTHQISAGRFLNKKQWHKQLRRLSSGATAIEDIKQINYPTLLALLKAIKYTGTRGKGLTIKLPLGRRWLKMLKKKYRRQDGNLPATYQVYYFSAVKPYQQKPK